MLKLAPSGAIAKILLSAMGARDFIFLSNALLTGQIFDGGFCADLCTKDDGKNLSGAADC